VHGVGPKALSVVVGMVAEGPHVQVPNAVPQAVGGRYVQSTPEGMFTLQFGQSDADASSQQLAHMKTTAMFTVVSMQQSHVEHGMHGTLPVIRSQELMGQFT